jgi:hypothetical protein
MTRVLGERMVVMYYCRCMDERVRVEHRVQRLGRKDEREGLPGESQKRAKEGGGVELKGREGGCTVVALGRQIVAGGLTSGTWALYTVILKRCSRNFVQGEWGIYMTHGG